MNKRWLSNRGFRDGKSRCADKQYIGEHCYLQGFVRGFWAAEASYPQKLNESDLRLYELGVKDGKDNFFREEKSRHEPYMEGFMAGYLVWKIFINETEDHVHVAQYCGSDRKEVFVPLIIAERDELRFSRKISCEEAHIPFAAPDLSDLEGVTEYELRANPD